MRHKKKFSAQKKNITKTYEPEFDGNNEEYEDQQYEKKKWYHEVSVDVDKFQPVTEQVLIELKDEAKKCVGAEVVSYNMKNSKTNSDYRWMKTVMSKGTVSDKIAANTVLIQDNPVTNLEMLSNLVSMVKVSKKKECIVVMETLTELFLSDLLRPNGKLRPFHQQPLSLLNEISSGNAITRKKYLSYWYFEDQLKEIYTSFVLALNAAAHDSLDANKEKSISAMYKLLCGNPEQEKNLLAYIVNKLGDPSQKVASKTIYCLCQLLYKHSNMQGVVLGEVEKLLFRPNVAIRAQYYGLCFLSQFYLSHESSEVARKLIELYFSFFKACIKKGDVDSRMMSALLMGVNRAYPYAKLELDSISEHIDTMYRVVHIANFNVSLHALSLLYQVSDYANNVNDRFYSALYKKLIDPKLSTTTHQAMMLNLLYRALLKDTQESRVKAFIKRLLQISQLLQPSFACGILFLVSQVMSKKANLEAIELKQDADGNENKFDDDSEEKYVDVLDTSAIKIEDEDEDVSPKPAEANTSDTGTEDVKPDVELLNAESKIGGSWFHRDAKIKKERLFVKQYDPMNRNPLYAGAEYSAYVELVDLKNSFHPTVALFAEKILNGEAIKYTGDPLKDFTLIRFLDRFVFKNPKKPEELTNEGSHPTFGKRKKYKPVGLRSLAVNSINYLNQNAQNIPVDELFLYTYLQGKYKEKETHDEDDSDLESVASEEFEEMLDKMAEYKNVDDDLDFMNDIGDNLKKKSKKGDLESDDNKESDDEEEMSAGEDDSADDDNENDSLGEEENLELEEDKELLDDLDDDDMSDIVFSSDEEAGSHSGRKKNKMQFKKKNDLNSIFASAEEFASILEDEGTSATAPGGSNVFSNKDKAGVKQLAWEENRNRWVQGFNKAVGGKNKDNRNKFSKKRPSKSKFNKNKKQKMS